MYNKFCIVKLSQSALNREVRLEFNYDIDPATAGVDSVKLSTLTGRILNFTTSVDGQDLILSLKEWPEPNIDYQLTIDTTLKTISGTSLDKTFRKKINFPQEITAQAYIKSPYNFEQVEELKFSIADGQDFNQYFIEVARDNIFYDIVYSEEIYTGDISPLIPNVLPGQYYLRARCQKNGNYGPWSKVVTFIYKYICDDEIPKEDGPSADASMPSAWDDLFSSENAKLDENGNIVPSVQPKPPTVEVEDVLEVMTKPESGETPKQFIFEFDKDLDICFGEVVIIKREF